MKTARLAALMLAFVCCACLPAWATTDESIFGRYAYADKSFSITFDWGLDCIHKLHINHHLYQQDISLVPTGVNDLFYSYNAMLPKKIGDKAIDILHFDVRFNSDDEALVVTGLYLELIPDASGVEHTVSRKVFILQRKGQMLMQNDDTSTPCTNA